MCHPTTLFQMWWRCGRLRLTFLWWATLVQTSPLFSLSIIQMVTEIRYSAPTRDLDSGQHPWEKTDIISGSDAPTIVGVSFPLLHQPPPPLIFHLFCPCIKNLVASLILIWFLIVVLSFNVVDCHLHFRKGFLFIGQLGAVRNSEIKLWVVVDCYSDLWKVFQAFEFSCFLASSYRPLFFFQYKNQPTTPPLKWCLSVWWFHFHGDYCSVRFWIFWVVSGGAEHLGVLFFLTQVSDCLCFSFFPLFCLFGWKENVGKRGE